MMRFLEMNVSHVPQVAALEKLCFADPWSEKSVASELHNDLALWLVAVEGETVLGYVGSQTVCGETDMMNVAVHPDHRRRGIAADLIEQLIRQLKNRGSCSLTLEVRASNAAAIALYRRNGFSEVGRRKAFYSKPTEDALILTVNVK
jgi:ribosomal-protein-alanine N-acetyltransferase